jgi:hypothetical protein
MWEIVFLSALARIGALRHEVPLSNGSRPDFEISALGTTILGDITTVSDAGRHTANPVHYLDAEIRRLAKKHLLHPNHFDLTVRGSHIGPFGDSRVKLKLPDRSNIQSWPRKTGQGVKWIFCLTAA